jgi:hypothetical protein
MQRRKIFVKKSIIAAPVLSLFALAGCASGPSQQQHQEANVAFKVTSPPQFPGHAAMVIDRDPSLKVGDSEHATGLFSLRECNSDKTDCKVGQGKVGANVKLVSLDADSATLQFALNMSIGDKQIVESKSATASTATQRSLGKDMPILTDKQSLTKTVELPYGAIGRINMNHGVAIRWCVLPGAPFTSPSECSGTEFVVGAQKEYSNLVKP